MDADDIEINEVNIDCDEMESVSMIYSVASMNNTKYVCRVVCSLVLRPILN